jgi:uncharacterized membrane protein
VRESHAADAPAARSRIDVVDLGRGAVVALMALDHTRTFFTSATYNPADLTRTFPALFFTRWISHFCTPLFLFLAGSGAYFLSRTRDRRPVACFLVTRGFVLVVLELTVVRWGWYFNLDYRHTSLQILWAIGVSMMALAPLLFLPTRLVGAIGVAIVALHNLVGPWIGNLVGEDSWLWAFLYERGREIAVAPAVILVVNFPVLTLFGVMAMGYAFGEILCWPDLDRRRACRVLGAGLLVTFLALRSFNLYGDPRPWTLQGDFIRSVMSFSSLTKHPFSLLMILATLGPALLWLRRASGWSRLAATHYHRARADGLLSGPRARHSCLGTGLLGGRLRKRHVAADEPIRSRRNGAAAGMGLRPRRRLRLVHSHSADLVPGVLLAGPLEGTVAVRLVELSLTGRNENPSALMYRVRGCDPLITTFCRHME